MIRYHKRILDIANYEIMKGAIMSQEVFQMANNMGIESLQIQLALQSAPLLTGEKISNLIIVSSCYAEAVMELFKNTEISFFMISYTEEKAIFLLYKRNELLSCLKQKEVRRFFAKAGYETMETFAKGKNIALFGSYGWGDGEWMRDWETRMLTAGAVIVNGEGLICHEAPDDNMLSQCKELGKQLAALQK